MSYRSIFRRLLENLSMGDVVNIEATVQDPEGAQDYAVKQVVITGKPLPPCRSMLQRL